MLENIRLAFQGIWAHKMRSVLTMLGIIIGIGSIIAIVSTIKGTNEQIKQNLVGAGNNAVNISLYNGEWQYEMGYEAVPDGVPVITEEERQEVEALDEVESASLYYQRNEYDAVYNGVNTMENCYVLGIDKYYLDVNGYQITSGRGMGDADFSKGRKVALIDSVASANLFAGDNPIGSTIEIKGEPYTVIGLIGKKKGSEPVINSISDYEQYAANYSSGTVCVPDSTWPIIYQYDEPQSMVVKAVTTDDMTAAGEKAAEILNSYLTVSDDSLQYKGEDLLQQAQDLQNLSASTNSQLIWIASISLLVGGIGVMNIMLVSVTERTREIGLKKALGARKTRILGQFLTEAAVLTGLGGILGIIVGIALAYAISALSTAPVAISVPAIIIAFLFSTIIGLVFGIIPSMKAANLNPIDALRQE